MEKPIIECGHFLELGDVDIYKKNYVEAIIHYKQALQLAQAYSLKINIDNCLFDIGHAYLLNTQYDSSEAYLKKSITFCC